MPSQEYWNKRAEERASRLYDKYDNTFKDLHNVFNQASKDIGKELSYFYSKYGVDAKSPVFETLKDGSKVLTGESVKRVVPSHEALKYKRLDSLQKQLNAILSENAKNQLGYMTTNLRLLAQEASNAFMFDVFQGYGVGYNFDLLDPKLVTEIIHSPVNGQDFSKRVWNNKNLLANQVNQELANGLIQGISTQEMSKRLADKMNSGYAVAERLMRTEISNTYNQSTLSRYKETGLVKQYEFLATLDGRTSDICQTLDLKVYDIDKAVVGLNYPPMHVNCRSTTVAKFDDTVFERRARDEQGNTYTVPSNMTYAEWAKSKNISNTIKEPKLKEKEKAEKYNATLINPKKINPVNPITDKDKFNALVYDFKKEGYNGRPIVAVKYPDDTYQALTGSHRIYAAREAGIEIPTSIIQYDKHIEKLLSGMDDDERKDIAIKLYKSGKIDKQNKSLLTGEIDINYKEANKETIELIKKKAELYDLEKKIEEEQIEENKKNEKIAREKAAQEKAKNQNESNEMKEYKDFLAEMNGKYTSIWAEMTDSEMSKLEELESSAYK